MIADCPTCHAPVEFRFDDSFVRVCDHCHNAVLRTDRGVETLGQLGDLAPIDSPLRLFAEGHDRSTSFLLVGMAQLRHAAGGVWQEWYAKLDGGWGWLSEAQGRFYMTYEAPNVGAPPYGTLAAGQTITLVHGGISRDYAVGELGSASYASARGEIPYRLVPDALFRYADLEAADGSFATIDYGDPADANARATVYVGRQLTLAELAITGGEVAPDAAAPLAQKLAATRVACPQCNGSLDIRAPGESLRVACPYCGALVSLEGALAVLTRGHGQVPRPAIALGSKGTFADGDLQVIGFLRRSAEVEGTWYPFDEYLLFAPAVGFRWLVCSDGHWSYVQPIAPGAVETRGGVPVYDGVTFKPFQRGPLRVDTVLGEMYWRVAAGDVVQGEDSIAPPAMLSRERTGTRQAREESWSLSSYLTPAQVRAALAQPALALPALEGIAPNQPGRGGSAARVLLLGLIALVGTGLVLAATSSGRTVFHDTISVPAAAGSGSGSGPGSGSDAVANAYFSAPFALASGKNIEIDFDASLSNDWAYAAADLVEDATGTVVSVDAELEHYSGVEDGESWDEGDASHSELIGPQPAGQYLLRVESQHGGPNPALLRVGVKQDVFRWLYFLIACGLMIVPWLLARGAAARFEGKRWENSSLPAERGGDGGGGGKRPKRERAGGLEAGLARLDHTDEDT